MKPLSPEPLAGTLIHRPVAAADLPAICAFPLTAEELFFAYPQASFPLTLPQLWQAISQRLDSTVVERAGEVVGFANFHRWETGGACAIGNVMVAPTARRQGVGRHLVETMIDLAFTRHQAGEVLVSCFNPNTAALLLYSRLGFQPYAIEERQNREGGRIALIHLRLPR